MGRTKQVAYPAKAMEVVYDSLEEAKQATPEVTVVLPLPSEVRTTGYFPTRFDVHLTQEQGIKLDALRVGLGVKRVELALGAILDRVNL